MTLAPSQVAALNESHGCFMIDLLIDDVVTLRSTRSMAYLVHEELRGEISLILLV